MPVRMFAAMARLLANVIERVGDGDASSAGRWRLNAGSPMLLDVKALRADGPVRVILDIASARFSAQRIAALYGHDDQIVVGYWDRASNTDGIDADFHPIEPANEIEAAAMPEVVRVRAQVRTGVPIQASIGAEPGDGGQYEFTAPGRVDLNGRAYQIADDGIPTYILRGGVITESSIVTFGADDATGRLAAKQAQINKDSTMSIDALKAALSKHPEKRHAMCARLIADGKNATEIDAAVRAADDADRDTEFSALKARCEELEKENADLKSKVKADDYNQGDKDKKAQQDAMTQVLQAGKGSATGVAFTGAADKTGDKAPSDLIDAMERLVADGSKLRGSELRAAARAKWPDIQAMSPDRIAATRKRMLA